MNSESKSIDFKKPSGYMCPDCGGSLFEVNEEGGLLKFRCRVGHAYSLKALLAAEDDAVEGALWAAVRSLEENAELKQNAASAQINENQLSRRLRDDAAAQREHARFLRELILSGFAPKRRA